MEKLFVPYELALKLREMGFEEKCFGCYMKSGELLIERTTIHEGFTLAPLYQQVIDWLREEKNMILVVNQNKSDNSFYCHIHSSTKCIASIHDCERYYEALSKGIEESVNLINQQRLN